MCACCRGSDVRPERCPSACGGHSPLPLLFKPSPRALSRAPLMIVPQPVRDPTRPPDGGGAPLWMRSTHPRRSSKVSAAVVVELALLAGLPAIGESQPDSAASRPSPRQPDRTRPRPTPPCCLLTHPLHRRSCRQRRAHCGRRSGSRWPAVRGRPATGVQGAGIPLRVTTAQNGDRNPDLSGHRPVLALGCPC